MDAKASGRGGTWVGSGRSVDNTVDVDTGGCSVVVVHGVDTNAIRAIWDRGRSAGAQRASMLSIVSRGNYPKSVADSVIYFYFKKCIRAD